MTTLGIHNCEDCGDVIAQYPLVAGVVAIVLGALAYAGVSLVMYGTLSTLEVSVFAVVFGVGYTGARYLRQTVDTR